MTATSIFGEPLCSPDSSSGSLFAEDFVVRAIDLSPHVGGTVPTLIRRGATGQGGMSVLARPAPPCLQTGLAGRSAGPAVPGTRRLARVERQCSLDPRAAGGRALDAEPAPQPGEPVVQPDEAAAARPGTADPVVAHLDPQRVVLDADD